MSLQIDTIAYTNRLRKLPPAHKVGFAIVLLLLTYSSQASVQLLITVWMSIWTVVYAGVSATLYLRLLFIPVAFWITSLPAFVINGVERAQQGLVQEDVWQGIAWGNFYWFLSHEGMQQAGELGRQTIAATACIYFVMLTVPFTELIEILRCMGCPVLLTDLFMIMYRFIFVLLRTANELWIAQQARNGYRTRQRWIISLGLLVGQLLRRTLENYRQMSLSLDSRGFSGEFRVCHSRRYVPSKRYSLEAGLGCLGLVGLVGWHYVVGI
ncbi:MAG: cobalt ECF transporter T component CbiQ [Leptolyngbyaceae cyanobacterium bins.59]|nr:cobalt ECF transporter T component CbiQ [Leptolyngbyaceae cyanobacterium bins.59]